MNKWWFVIRKLKAIKAFLKDKSASKLKKLIMLAAIAYLLMPIDAIPIFFFPIGVMDDAVIMATVLWYLKDTIKEYEEKINTEPTRDEFKDREIIDDVKFEVQQEERCDKKGGYNG